MGEMQTVDPSPVEYTEVPQPLHKQSKSGLQQLKRWFLLDDDGLKSFRKQNDKKPS